MVKGTTKSGFTIEIDENALNNMELLDALNEMDNNPLAISNVCTMILGKEGKKAMYEHLRQKDGRVPVELVGEELKEIFGILGKAGKNS